MYRKAFMMLTICLAGFVTNGFAQTDEFHLDETYSIDSGGTINLSSDDANVQITGSNRENVRVIVHYKLTVRGITFGEANEFEMIVEEHNGNLTIHEKERDFGRRGIVGFRSEEYTIEIETPYDVNLNVEGDDGEYDITGIAGSLRLEADDTDAQISDCSGDDFAFFVDDGSIQMDGGAGRLKIEADDGDVVIDGGNFTEIDADSDDSSIEISTSLADDGDYRFDMDDADLVLSIAGGGGEFDIRHDDADISAGREFEQIRDEEGTEVHRLQGGNARVVIRSDDGDIDLRVF